VEKYSFIYIYIFYFKITAHHVTYKKHSLLTYAECYNILLYTTVTNTFTYKNSLTCLQLKFEVFWSFKQQHNCGSKMELAKWLSFAHMNFFTL